MSNNFSAFLASNSKRTSINAEIQLYSYLNRRVTQPFADLPPSSRVVSLFGHSQGKSRDHFTHEQPQDSINPQRSHTHPSQLIVSSGAYLAHILNTRVRMTGRIVSNAPGPIDLVPGVSSSCNSVVESRSFLSTNCNILTLRFSMRRYTGISRRKFKVRTMQQTKRWYLCTATQPRCRH